MNLSFILTPLTFPCNLSRIPRPLQHTATHCNTLQHTATHCNTLQHTTTHYDTLLCLVCAILSAGCHSTKLHRAYSLFYLIGTYGAVHVPVVGWAPLKSLEQLGAFGVFIALQLMEFCEVCVCVCLF